MTVLIDVISDVICPWCFIGKRRLEKAIALNGSAGIQVRWHPFQLNPEIPKEGLDRRQYRIAKFGSWERSQALDANVAAAGAADGIAFAFDQMARTPNTYDAHRLIWLADELGVQDALVERLFLAYFTEGRDLTKKEILVELSCEAGLERNRVISLLDSDEGADLIEAEEFQARQLGVQGVPFFIVNKQLALSGARDPSEFLAALRDVNVLSNTEGAACETDKHGQRKC